MPPDLGSGFLLFGKLGAGPRSGGDRMMGWMGTRRISVGPEIELDQPDQAPRTRFGPLSALGLALCFGLVAGLAEVAVLGLQDLVDPVVTVDSIRTNRHYAWMIPISNAGLFAVVGVGFAVAVVRWPRGVGRWEPAVLAFPATVAPLLAVRGLYPVAAVVLGLGVATRVAGWVGPRPDRVRRAVQVGLPVLVVAVAILAAIKPGRPAPVHHQVHERAENPPNVLLLVLDTVRADHLSLYGYNRPTTPNLQRWAKRGIRFDKARATAPWTLPSHASMLTGHWPHQLSADVSHPLDAAKPTLAEFLGDRGYATGGFVANTYYCNAWYGVDRGFDRYEDFPENAQTTPAEILQSSTLGRRVARKLGFKLATPGSKGSRKSAATINRDALAWVDGQPAGKPFFAFLNYYDAHAPYEMPDGYQRQFARPGATDAHEAATIHEFEEMAKHPAPADPEAVGHVQTVGAEAAAIMVDAYDDCIATLDAEVGRLLDTLDARGTLANTLVIITSDHGEHFGDRGLFGHGVSLYHPLIDVPLLVIPPSQVHAGSNLVIADPVSLRDIPSTVVDLLHLGGSPFPGESLASRWDGSKTRPIDPPLSLVEQQKRFPPSAHIPASLGPLWSLVQDGATYIRQSDGSEHLYDSVGDPLEIRDLAAAPEHQPSLVRFRTTLNRLLRNPAPRQVETANAHLSEHAGQRR